MYSIRIIVYLIFITKTPQLLLYYLLSIELTMNNEEPNADTTEIKRFFFFKFS